MCKSKGETITESEMATLFQFVARNKGIRGLTRLEVVTGLSRLALGADTVDGANSYGCSRVFTQPSCRVARGCLS